MNTKRTVIGIARHGCTPNGTDGLSLDALTDESVQAMYDQSLHFNNIIGEGAKSDKVFVLHSDKNRTVGTAKARLAGIRDITPKPQTEEDLDNFQYNGTLFIRDDRLSYENLEINYDAVQRMSLPEYGEWMLANRDATEIDGKQVTSFQQLYDTRKPVLGDAVRRLDAGDYDLGFISTHGSLTDAIAMAAADSTRKTPTNTYETIGGQFSKEDIAYLIIDTNTKSGTTNARLIRDDVTLPVDVNRIRVEY